MLTRQYGTCTNDVSITCLSFVLLSFRYNLIEDKSNPADHQYSTAHYGTSDDAGRAIYATPEDVYEYQDRASTSATLENAILGGRAGAATPAPDVYEYQDTSELAAAAARAEVSGRSSRPSVESLEDDANLTTMRRVSGLDFTMAGNGGGGGRQGNGVGSVYYVEPNSGRRVSYVDPNSSMDQEEVYHDLDDDATITSMRRSSLRWSSGAKMTSHLSGTTHLEPSIAEDGVGKKAVATEATLPADEPDPAAWC